MCNSSGEMERALFIGESAFLTRKGEFWGDYTATMLSDERIKLHGARLMASQGSDARALLHWLYDTIQGQIIYKLAGNT